MFKPKQFFLELLSFTTARAKVINLLAALGILSIINPERLGSYCIFKNIIFPLIFKTCPTKGLFVGCNCPACGLTRATGHLLHGNLKQALEFNKLIIIVFPVIIFILGLNIYKLIKKK